MSTDPSIGLKRDEAGRLKSPTREMTKKTVARDSAGRIASVTEEVLPADASPAEIRRAVQVTAEKLANDQTAQQAVDVVQRAANAAVATVKQAAKEAMDSALAKMDKPAEPQAFKRPQDEDPADAADDDEDEGHRPAAVVEEQRARARYKRSVLDRALEDDEVELTEKDIAAIVNEAVAGVLRNIDRVLIACGYAPEYAEKLAATYGRDPVDASMDHEDEEDYRPESKRGRNPRVLEERPKFRFPDSTDMGKPMSATRKSRYGQGPVFGPRRWSR